MTTHGRRTSTINVLIIGHGQKQALKRINERDEGKEHVAMILGWIRRQDAKFDPGHKRFLFA